MGNRFYTDRYKVLASTHLKRLCYSNGQIWIEDENHKKNRVKIRLSKLSQYRLAERILRLTPRVGFTVHDVFYFSLRGCLFRVNEKSMEAQVVYRFRPNMNNPLSICKCQWDQQENIYWGEYWPNPNHEQVSIFAFDGNQVTKVCTLLDIKHVHTIVWDQYRECFWITTGDTDTESRIYRASRTFDELTIVFSGQQKYRTCVLFPMEQGLLYATDSPVSPNELLFSRFHQNQFLEPVVIKSMPGPCIYGQEFHGLFCFSTSVESNPNQHVIKYWLSWKIGPGNVDRQSHVICVTHDLKTSEVFSAKKDIHNMAILGFGNIQLTYDAYTDALACYCSSLKKYDGQSVLLTLRN